MQKIKFDFEATKERIYAPNSNVPIGAPVDRNGNIANDGNAYGIVLCKETENEKYWVRYNLVVMVAGYCDIIDAQEIWGDEYSAEAIAAMSDIVFCDDHKIGGGGGWPSDLPKPSVGGYGYTEQGEQTVITWDGDTAGKTVVDDFWCKVSTNIVPNSDILGMEFSAGGETVKVDQEYYEGLVSSGALTDELVYVSDFVVLVRQENAIYDGHRFDETGVYFGFEGDAHVESLTYGTPDTVHKIDEKYLPSGGAMAVVVDFDEDSGELVCNHTLSEIVQNFPNVIFCAHGNVGGNVWLIKDSYSGEVESVRAQLISADAAGGNISGLGCYEYDISENSVTEDFHSVSFI